MKTIQAGINVEVKASEEDDRVLTFTGSNEILDRQDEVVLADGWDLDNYRKNPVILFAHQYDQPPVGKAEKVWVSNGALKFRVRFPTKDEYPFADTLYRLYKGGYMHAVSVGFLPREWEWGKGDEDPRRTYTEQELLELSLVPVPANPDALINGAGLKSARAAGDLDDRDVEDLRAMLGKACQAPKSAPHGANAPGDDPKSVSDKKTVYGPDNDRRKGDRRRGDRRKSVAGPTAPGDLFSVILQDLRGARASQGAPDGAVVDMIETLKSMKKENHHA